MEARVYGIQGQPWLLTEFEINLDYREWSCFKGKNKTKEVSEVAFLMVFKECVGF
jgi:hypothetical protein